ncbi:MAG: hypothetical protein IIZ97_03825, partial [Prevotella sp.]|nr:hypothetical protein [Prevotella sp.]
MRRYLFIILIAFGISVTAQGQQKFDPERYQADLEQFITSEACLTPQESARFFPVYREMMKKQ